MNRLKTLVLLATLTALLVWTGGVVAGRTGLFVALAVASVMNFGAYWFSDKVVLRMYGARALREDEIPWLASAVRELALCGNLPVPGLYLIPDDAPNAFATGRNPEHAAVAVTQGLITRLDRNEIVAVIAHELGHIRNRDTLVMTLAATIAGALSMLANMAMWGAIFGVGRSSDEEEGNHPLGGLVGLLIAPVAATLIQMAISRSREFLADAAGARLGCVGLGYSTRLPRASADLGCTRPHLVGRGVRRQPPHRRRAEGEHVDLKKLQSWLEKIRKLDFYGATLAADAEQRLQACEALLEAYAERVFEAHDENR